MYFKYFLLSLLYSDIVLNQYNKYFLTNLLQLLKQKSNKKHNGKLE